jgi:hypothetical protein
MFNIPLGLFCIIIALIINHFSNKTPDELQNISFFTNILTRIAKILQLICKTIHPIKFLIGCLCLYLILTLSIPNKDNISTDNFIIKKNETLLSESQNIVFKECQEINKTQTKLIVFHEDYKSKGILLSAFEVSCSLLVIIGFGFLRSISDLNPLFHKPLDLEQGKFMRFIFRSAGP